MLLNNTGCNSFSVSLNVLVDNYVLVSQRGWEGGLRWVKDSFTLLFRYYNLQYGECFRKPENNSLLNENISGILGILCKHTVRSFDI